MRIEAGLTANGKRDEDGSFATPRNFLHSFWAVFTLPFRTVRFIFRRLGDIPVKNLILMSAIFIILIGVTLVAVIKATSQPGFCVSCHYMRPYFASWEESTHNDVHCTECHFPPGIRGTVEGKFTAIAMVANYFTGVYKKSKPWAEISDKSCLRSGCHETRVLSGQVPFKEGIVFDHEPHLTEDRRGKNLRCTSCHSQIVQGSHMKVTEESCFLCHFKDQEPDSPMNACTYCHDAPTTADSANVVFDHTDIIDREADCKLCHGSMVQGEGDVQKERCSYCHADEGKLEKEGITSWPIWEKENSRFNWSYDTIETCYILEGKAKVETEDGEIIEFGEGDMVVFPEGLNCVWEITSPIKKYYRMG